MGVKCTLLGHKYGDSEIEREREERGDEAVVTIREVRTCDRCGNRSVVSENKEVSTVAPPDDGPPASEPDPVEPATPEAPIEEAEGPEQDPETDDGVILEDDDEPEEPEERQYGEWPDAEEDHATAEADPVAADQEEAPAEWPDAGGEDEGVDATVPDDEEPDVEYPRMPEEDVTEAADAGAGQSGSPQAGSEDTGMQRAGEAAPPDGPTTEGTELHCPACGYRDPSRDGSLREGDICPECKSGYLSARD